MTPQSVRDLITNETHSGAVGGPAARLLVLLGLNGFAIAMPLLAFLGESPTFFTFRNATGQEILLLAVAIAVVPAVLMWAVDLLAGAISESASIPIHLATCGGLTALATVRPRLVHEPQRRTHSRRIDGAGAWRQNDRADDRSTLISQAGSPSHQITPTSHGWHPSWSNVTSYRRSTPTS